MQVGVTRDSMRGWFSVETTQATPWEATPAKALMMEKSVLNT